jgi:hypothetical protein
VSAHVPEPPRRAGEAQRQLRIVVGPGVECDRRQHVLVLGLEPRQRARLRGTARQRRRETLHRVEVRLAMPHAESTPSTRCFGARQRRAADRLEQAIARLGPVGAHDRHQRTLEQPRQRIERREAVAIGGRHGRGHRQVEPAAEHAERGQEGELIGLESGEARLQRRAHRVGAGLSALELAGQHRERLLGEANRRQLDRERHSIEHVDDGCDAREIRVGEHQVRRGSARGREEQAHGIVREQPRRGE